MDSILTVGIASRDTLLAMGISSGKIIMGFNAVDVRRYAQDARGMRRGVPPLPGHHTLYVGRLIEGKNIQSALIAWVKARRPEDTFTVVGSGPLEDRLVSLVHQLQIQDSVRFVGHLSGDRLTSEYARAQTLILPSTKEVWGLVVNEALASGIHAVVSDAAGVAASVAGMPGVFVAHPDITSLAAALEASRSSWRGPIDNPPILEQSPEQLAVAALEAIDLAIRVYRK
jgi:glycosyltransferase involved in cell wall biosynthesis